MLGVCRGLQFLHVMAGGALYQHVNNHNGDHPIFCVKSKQRIDKASSVHHQMCIPSPDIGFELIATSQKADERWLTPSHSIVGNRAEVEAAFYRDTCAFGVQGHPEYTGYPRYTKWCLDMIEQLIKHNPDIENRKGKMRIKQELLDERELRNKEPVQLSNPAIQEG